MADYASKGNAAEIAGLTEADILDAQIEIVNRFIDALVNRNFGVANTRNNPPQYFDIEGDERELLLDRWPVIAITELVDNQRGASPSTLVQDTDYFLEGAEGVIKLVEDEFNILKGSAYLTRGMRTVRCIYTWGYEDIPAPVSAFADWMAAWIAEIKKATGAAKTAEGQVLRKLRAGNYEEAYDIGNTIIDKKYKAVLSDMTQFLIRNYMRYGDSI